MIDRTLPPKLESDEGGAWRVRKWQEENSDLLALCPRRWAGLNDAQKWAALRILAQRDEHEPDFLDPDIWNGLRDDIDCSTYDIDTTLLIDASPDEGEADRERREHAERMFSEIMTNREAEE